MSLWETNLCYIYLRQSSLLPLPPSQQGPRECCDRMRDEFAGTTPYGGENRQLQNKVQDQIHRSDDEVWSSAEIHQRATYWHKESYRRVEDAVRQLRESDAWRDVSVLYW